MDVAASIADPALEDWTLLPFVTIDNSGSKDLDQAVHVARDGDDFLVRYALADAAHFVPKGSALFAECLRRGASVYFPGFSVPMLPRALSEGIVSLNPDGPRRALAFEMRVGKDGVARESTVHRVRISSRAKLSFAEVEALYDEELGSPLVERDFTASLHSLRDVGIALGKEAAGRSVVRYRRHETEYSIEGQRGERLVLARSPRRKVELYNEQISLLCNREGARLLLEGRADHVQPVFRVHPAPAEERLAGLEAQIAGIVRVHGPGAERFAFHRGGPYGTLSEYLDALPHEGREGRIAQAIHRLAVVVNTRSSFAADVGAHFGVGAEAYARFSAPMREIVGVFVHHEMLELLRRHGGADMSLREAVVDAANRSKEMQRKANEQVSRLYLDSVFSSDLRLAAGERPSRLGTVMGLSPSKVLVALDDPPVDVKLYVRDLGRARGGAWLTLTDDGAALSDETSGERVLRVGDAARVVLEGRDPGQDRWILQLVPGLENQY